MGAFAAERDNLQHDDPRARARRSTTTNIALTKINAALPPTRAFAREILPGVRETRRR